jgi:hypothetical protein
MPPRLFTDINLRFKLEVKPLSISQIQYRIKKEQFKKKLLEAGIQPNNYELNSMLSSFYKNRVLGLPYYSPIKQKPYEASDKEAYNHNFLTFMEDIDTAYSANIEANNKAIAIREYYDIETTKISNAIAKLSLRVDNISKILNANTIAKQYVEAFDDCYGIEFYGNSGRNIPYTTAFIDMLQKKVYTEKANTKINKLNLSNVNITIMGANQFTSFDVQGQPENILTDTVDSLYIISGKSKNQKEKVIEINIDLKSQMDLNTVMFSFTSSRDMACELSLSEDNENFVPLHDLSGKRLLEWNFATKTVRYIKIRCIKTEPDGYSPSDEDDGYFEYYYVLKNISVAIESFENKSVFVSKKITFNDLVSSIRLDATDMIYNNTRIDYFIGYDNDTSKIGWDKIENHSDNELFMFEKTHKIANFSVANYAEMDPGAKQLYQIYELPKTANLNSIKITPAYNMWAVRRYRPNGSVEGAPAFSFDTFDFNAYTAGCEMDYVFMDCENYNSFSLDPNALYIFTQYVSLDKPYNAYNKFIKIMDHTFQNMIPGVEQKVFLNGAEIVPAGNNNYSF